MRQTILSIVVFGLFVLADLICPESGIAVAGSSTATLGVSLTIVAGCSAVAGEIEPKPTVRCDNVVPFRVEVRPVAVAIEPEPPNGDHNVRVTTVLVVY
jgi:hypothetical protein